MHKKKTTIIRKIDELGRLVLPRDVRKQMDIHSGDLLEINCTSDSLSITKYSSIEEIDFLAEILLNTIYEYYHVEGLLLEGDQIIRYPSFVTRKKLENKLLEENYVCMPILLDDKEAGKFLIFSSDEKWKDILSFITLFLKNYLEEN